MGSKEVGDHGLMDTLLGTPALSERRRVFLWGTIVEAAPAPGLAVVSVIGRLDLASAADVQRNLVATIAAGRRRLVLDLGAMAFVDSAGVRALLDTLQLAQRAGGVLRLAHTDVQARLVMQRTGVEQVMPSFETVERALTDF
jgi:anti-sigma B factor antagonist